MAGGKFSPPITMLINRTLDTINDHCYSIVFQFFTSIVRLTPSPANPGDTAKGVLSNNWFPSVGTPSSETTTSRSPFGGASLDRINRFTKGGKEFKGKDGKVYLTNNIIYAYRAEAIGWPQKEGWVRNIGPYRMVAKSLQAVVASRKGIKRKKP